MDDAHQSALDFLQDLESRHTHVLDELDSLNSRIEAVLEMYTQSRVPATEGES
ncbi:MAG: hypothetical protein R3C53_08695 [Pirellulaceae bacterium]